MTNRECKVDGCDRPVRCRGKCNAHYRRELDRRGKATTAQCVGCGTGIDLFEIGAAGRKRRGDVLYCDGCKPARAAARDRRANGTSNPLIGIGDSWCRRCAKALASGRYCQTCEPASMKFPDEWKPCEQCSFPIDMSRRDSLGRRRRRDVRNCDWCRDARLTSHKVSIGLVVERDGLSCGVCREPVDPWLSAPHPGSPTVDHVKPVSLGGEPGIENTQLAHRRCNQIKQQRVGFTL